jgi:hypothetical protein
VVSTALPVADRLSAITPPEAFLSWRVRSAHEPASPLAQVRETSVKPPASATTARVAVPVGRIDPEAVSVPSEVVVLASVKLGTVSVDELLVIAQVNVPLDDACGSRWVSVADPPDDRVVASVELPFFSASVRSAQSSLLYVADTVGVAAWLDESARSRYVPAAAFAYVSVRRRVLATCVEPARTWVPVAFSSRKSMVAVTGYSPCVMVNEDDEPILAVTR